MASTWTMRAEAAVQGAVHRVAKAWAEPRFRIVRSPSRPVAPSSQDVTYRTNLSTTRMLGYPRLMSIPFAGPVKRSVTIAGHATSVSLEPAFWQALEEIAGARGLPLNALVAAVDAERVGQAEPANLASALRVWVLTQFRDNSAKDSH